MTVKSLYYQANKDLFDIDAKVNSAKGALLKPEYIVVEGSGLDVQRQQTQYLIEKFNLWASKQNGMVRLSVCSEIAVRMFMFILPREIFGRKLTNLHAICTLIIRVSNRQSCTYCRFPQSTHPSKL